MALPDEQDESSGFVEAIREMNWHPKPILKSEMIHDQKCGSMNSA
jgi:hypothetical protein